mmetsp:Transcript_4980/g.16318  ORF Transcript_4980/g.16318 Transcript_4980/m.16318 type:complete len:296 (-) Transcript_4980:1568-2455(-)|eukprot:CAMPEP_0118896594 /NCGR_PEP_ID=MMETSP1166-20130328/4387_1 /TAXON_ID=1104430 /ORGANISM="Chrysoreinhardia sp, Strain CCMP3193" /LENGTH=295 /DNA_ID=CAMNT_0006835653 /DNA_START=65 /DNA_END=952 /DNA_ORIENTATION=+
MAPNFLEHRYTFFFMRRDQHRKSGEEAAAAAQHTTSYASSIIKIGSFDSAEGFFGLYDHLLKPSSSACIGTDYHLFRQGVTPTWEDAHNKNGGKWILRLRKSDDGLSSLYWEELLLAIIGEQFGDLTDHISGAVVSIRANDDIISLWNVDANDHVANAEIRETIKRLLQLPNFVQLEYKKHAMARTHVWHRQSKGQQGASGGGGGLGGGPPNTSSSSSSSNQERQAQLLLSSQNQSDTNRDGRLERGDRERSRPYNADRPPRTDYQHHHRGDRNAGQHAASSSGDRDWSTLRKKT